MRRRVKNEQGFGYESLEPRKLLAGAVFVNWTGQDLVVIGNQEDNSVAINLNATTVEQLVQGYDGTQVRYSDALLNGFDSDALYSLRVYGNDGNDTIVVDARSITSRSELLVSLGSGDDSLYVKGGTFEGDATVYGLAGDDSLYFDETVFQGDFAAITGEGSDAFAWNYVDAYQQTRFLGQNGNDTAVIYDSKFTGNAYFEMGGDDDRFETVESEYGGEYLLAGVTVQMHRC